LSTLVCLYYIFHHKETSKSKTHCFNPFQQRQIDIAHRHKARVTRSTDKSQACQSQQTVERAPWRVQVQPTNSSFRRAFN